MTEWKRRLITNDWQVPFHDPHAIELLVRIVGVWQPHVITLNGDLCDMYELSDFDRNPERLGNGGIQSEVDQFRKIVGEIRHAAPSDVKLEMIPGNHEDRLRRFLWRNPRLATLHVLDLPALLGLEELGVEFHSHEITAANGNLIIKHGTKVRPEGGGSAQSELAAERYAVSTITGHTHRMGCTYVRTRRGVVGAWEGGCLCSLHPEWGNPNPNWQHGVTLVLESVSGDSFSVTQVPFLGEGKSMKAVVEGRTIRL